MDAQPPSVPPNQPESAPTNDGDTDLVFCDSYVNRWGKLMIAKDYGYDKWCLRIKGRRRNGSQRRQKK